MTRYPQPIIAKRQRVAFRRVGAFERCPCGDWTSFNNLPLCKPCWRDSGAWRRNVAYFHRLSWLDKLCRWWMSRRWRYEWGTFTTAEDDSPAGRSEWSAALLDEPCLWFSRRCRS